MSKKRPQKTYDAAIDGQKVSINQYEPYDRRRTRHARSNNTSCPYCLSLLKADSFGTLYCTSTRLKIWEKQFAAFHALNAQEQEKYLGGLSNTGRFKELYDRWKYAFENNLPDEYNCEFSNQIFPIISASKNIIPDPLFCKKLEEKLGRPLTEEELRNESELYFYQGQVLTDYRKRAKLINIPHILLPDEIEVYG